MHLPIPLKNGKGRGSGKTNPLQVVCNLICSCMDWPTHLATSRFNLSDGAGHSTLIRSYLLSKTTGTASPSDTFTVGATVDVDNTQISGTYTGSFSVSVNYQ